MRVQITTLQCLLSQGQQTGLFPQQKMNHVGFQTKYLTSIAFFFIWADRDRSFWWSHGRIAAFNKAAKYFSNTVLGPVNQSCRFSLLWKLKDELLSSYISLITVFIFVYWTQVSDLISRDSQSWFNCLWQVSLSNKRVLDNALTILVLCSNFNFIFPFHL